MMKTISTLGLAAMLLGGVGCGHSSAPDLPDLSPEAVIAGKAPVNLLDADLEGDMGAERADYSRLDDGRLLVRAALRNATKKPLHVEARTVFKDETGLSIGDETQWKPLFFAPQQSQTYRAESMTTAATSFTIEVRRP